MKPPRPLQVPPALFTSDGDARRLARWSALYGGLILLHYGLVLFARVPPWTMALLLPLLMVRYITVLHELLHTGDAAAPDPLARLWLVHALLTPLSPGWREFRDMHRRHHASLLSDDDPDCYQIRCSVAAGYFHTLTSPEQSLFRHVAKRGLDRSLAAGVLARAAIFTSLAAAGGWAFLWFCVPLRLAYGTALFVFSHRLHRRGGRLGVFSLDLSPLLRVLLWPALGRMGIETLSHHDVHHANARVAPHNLALAREMVMRQAA